MLIKESRQALQSAGARLECIALPSLTHLVMQIYFMQVTMDR